MSLGLSNTGELALLREYFANHSVEFGVYNDSTDNLQDGDTVADISTEPTGSNYSRQSVTNSDVTITLDANSENALLVVSPQPFEVSDSSQKIDAGFLYNPADDFFVRIPVDTSSYPNDYIDLAQLDNLNLGGEAVTLD